MDRLRAEAANIAAEVAVPAIWEDEEVESTGWTKALYVEAVARLMRKHHVQAAAIYEAVETGNSFIPRERIYKIGSYPETRSLKGFTRPVNRVQQDLIDEGALPEDAADLIETVYDPNIVGYQRAVGFHVPLEIIRIARQTKKEQEAKNAEGETPA